MSASPTVLTSSLLLGRVLGRAVSPVLARLLGPPVMAVMMGLVWMLQALPIDTMRRDAAAQGPGEAAFTLVLIALLQAMALRPALRVAWRSPAVELLDRQPLSWPVWSIALLPMALSLASPAGLLALFWPWRAPILAAGQVFGLASVLMFLAGRPDLGRWGWSAAAAVGGGISLLAARTWPALEAPISVLSLFVYAILLGPARLNGARRLTDESAAPAVRPRGPLTALVSRDALALWRLDRWLVLGSGLGLALPWPLLRGLSRNGGLAGPGLEVAALILMALASPLLAMLLSQLGERLGPRLDVPEWPVSAASRVLTLGVIPAIWSVLAVTALVSAAPEPLLPWGALRLGGLGFGLAGLGALLAVYRWPPQLNMGVWCALVTLLTATGALAGRGGALLTLTSGLVALAAAAHRLDLQRSART